MALLLGEIDEFGFQRSEEEKTFFENNEKYFVKLTSQLIQWNNLQNSYLKNNILFRSIALKKFIRKGVPLSLRKQGRTR